jgi:hypothetical protein
MGTKSGMDHSRGTGATRGVCTGLLGFLALLSGCAQQTPPAEPASAQGQTSPEPVPVENAEEPETSAETTPAPPSEEPAPPAEPAPQIVARVCEEGCAKMDSACSARSASFCRASCRDYVSASEKCPVEVEDALSCQAKAEDFLLCSNIAAESCTPLFRAMTECREGRAEAQARRAPEPEKSNVPQGWARFSVSQAGYSVLVPDTMRFSSDAAAYKASGKDAQGIEYRLEPLVTDGREPTAANILRSATAYLGNACQPKLRLYGHYESGVVKHVRFDTVCEDGSAWHGMLHFWEKKGAVTTTYLEPSQTSLENPHLEAFLFGFEKAAP